MEFRFPIFGYTFSLKIAKRIPTLRPQIIPRDSKLWQLLGLPVTADKPQNAWLDSAREFQSSERWNDDPGYSFILQNLPQPLQQSLPLLDIGCGMGQLVSYLKHLDLIEKFDYRGYDFHEPSLQVARELHPGFHFEQHDCQQPIKEKTDAGLILSKGTLISMLRPDLALQQMLTLKPATLLLIHTALTNDNSDDSAYQLFIQGDHKQVSVYSVLSRQWFLQQLKNDYLIQVAQRRKHNQFIEGLGHYALYDFALLRQ